MIKRQKWQNVKVDGPSNLPRAMPVAKGIEASMLPLLLLRCISGVILMNICGKNEDMTTSPTCADLPAARSTRGWSLYECPASRPLIEASPPANAHRRARPSTRSEIIRRLGHACAFTYFGFHRGGSLAWPPLLVKMPLATC